VSGINGDTEIKKDVFRACGAHGRKEKFIHNHLEDLKEGDHLEDLSVDGTY
jgi:hypothetical protein